MNKIESYGVTLVPIAFIAAILSGSLVGQPPGVEEPKVPPKAPEAARRAEDTRTTHWLSDLRPVMEAMGDAMGLSLQRDAGSRTIGLNASDFNQLQPASVTEAFLTLGSASQRFSDGKNACAQDALDSRLTRAEKTLSAYLLSEKDSDSSSRTLRLSAAEAALSDLQDWRA